MGTLSIVATPIGNLSDITERALDTLREADVVLCEDTRVTRNLLERFEIPATTKAFHQHSSEKVFDEVLKMLEQGQHLALVTDAGTPGVSDPGNRLVAYVAKHGREDIVISPIPGPSAVTAALSIAGFPTDKFLFLGFPPHKKKRNQFFEHVALSPFTVVFYESNHRIKKAIGQLVEVLDPERKVCICRELTKKFESVYRGTIEEIAEMEIPEKGEFVVIVK